MTTDPNPLATMVSRRAIALARAYQRDEPSATADLARLRRLVPDTDEVAPEAWELVQLPDAMIGEAPDPNVYERAAQYAATAALGLFALHQQSGRDHAMHKSGWENHLGRSLALLRLRRESGIDAKVRALVRADRQVSAVRHLRSLVGLLRSEQIPVDYGDLAASLHQLTRRGGPQAVRIRWMRDYRRPLKNDETVETPTDPPPTDAASTATGDPS
ncbi:type I-E CRISPR-associated protein Cse2/CasB [Nocardioides acrostichi]|uniref:Type I-E CRISPR-associated protein Cse2/CasB n=1 Tax=Nocardioides acrostichi TaxID=2784339 RepID=A0A930YC14_9ACTN|nr:type I-E CRISPR-associated protein Cse2/CasB [Nocardioides acrostichi]MBF4163028.1 type I-E CRISPR-associated protein Cse2/CasB [Nocardioides acrostichi]